MIFRFESLICNQSLERVGITLGLWIAGCFIYAQGTISPGEIPTWQALQLDWQGPSAIETDSSPNPFLDYRLQVTFTGPSDQAYEVPGFFAGNGEGEGEGDVWRVRFTPDEPGMWRYEASFREGEAVAISLEPEAGKPTAFDGDSGSFTVSARDTEALGFLRWGRLEYTGGHYLKFRDGPYFIKAGTDSPEDMFGYGGFDDTPNSHDFDKHVTDWREGDPDWGEGQGKGIIGALNYLGAMNVNSIYFLPMNIGGDGKNTWPFVGDIDPEGSSSNNNLNYDISKLEQWEIVFEHAQRQGILLHFVLTEGEVANKEELDDASLGPERKLFYRELVARFAHHNAVLWNIAEEYNIELDLGVERVKEFAAYLRAVDPYIHPITVHNFDKARPAWTPFLGDELFSITSIQYGRRDLGLGDEVEAWRVESTAAGHPLSISLDEFRRTTPDNLAAQRKEFLWPILLSGGQLEYIIEGTRRTDDFRPYEDLWTWTWYARKFMEENLPFWQMEPMDDLLSGEAEGLGKGQVFALEGETYAVYLPQASSTGTLDLNSAPGTYEKRWFNPRTGKFEGDTEAVEGGAPLPLGTPPNEADEDWALLLTRQ